MDPAALPVRHKHTGGPFRLAGPASHKYTARRGSAGGMQSLHAPTPAFVFALLLVAYTVRDLDRKAGVDGYFSTSSAGHSRPPGPRWPPRLRAGRAAVFRLGRPGAAIAPSRPWRSPRPPRRRRCHPATG